jgi:hypothetical protein
MPAQGRPWHHDTVDLVDLNRRLPFGLPLGVSFEDWHSQSARSRDMKIGWINRMAQKPIFEIKLKNLK